MDNSDKQLELAVLNTVLRNRSALVQLMDEDNIFYFQDHRKIYDVLKTMYDVGRDVDVVSVYDELQKSCGAGDFLDNFANGMTSPFFRTHIESLVDLWKKRNISREAEIIFRESQKRITKLDALTDALEKTLRNTNRNKPVNYISATSIDPDEQMANEKAWPTGFSDIDRVINGFYGGQFVILGARTRIGKSAIALQMASHVARENHSLFFSLEMPVKQIFLRMLSMETGFEMWRIRSNRLNEVELKILFQAATRIRNDRKYLTFVDNSYTLQHIINNIRKYFELYGKCFVVVDYLQLVSLPKMNNRYLEIGEITRSLKLLSMELDIPIMGLSQLNRGSEGEVPKLSDLRESGNLEQDADMVLFLHRDKDKNECEFIIAKNRDGATKTIDMWFDAQRMSFRCMA